MGRETWNEIVAEFELALLEPRAYADAAWQSLQESFLLPGDYIIAVLSEHAPDQSALGLAAHGETYAIVLSAVAWFCLLLAILRCLRFAGQALAGCWFAALRAGARAVRIVRPLRLRLAEPVRALQRRRLAGRYYSEEFSINALQMAVMNAQRRLPPGHVATAIDIAGDLRLRPGPVEQALESLKKLHLVEVAFATSDGYPGYLLTKPGEIFLSTCAGATGPAPATRNSIRMFRAGPAPVGRRPGAARPS